MRAMRMKLVAVVMLACVAMAWAGEDQRPEFPDIVISNLEGQPCSVKDFRGVVTVLNFWATWCGPCRLELPELQRLYNELGAKGFVVATINVDGPRAPIRPYFERMGLTLPAYSIDAGTDRLLGISSIPFTVLLDRQGRVVRAYAGYSREEIVDLRRQVEDLLAKGKG
jgi:thiol-disulfide isomerase/thioredoxin